MWEGKTGLGKWDNSVDAKILERQSPNVAKLSARPLGNGRRGTPEWFGDALDRTLPRAIRLWHAKLVAARMLVADSPRSRWAAPMAIRRK